MVSKNRAFIEVGDGEETVVRRRRVTFVLFEHFSLMAFTGALDALVTANLVKSKVDYEVSVVSVDGHKVISDLGIEVAVDYSLENLQEDDVDYLMLCGGYRLEMHSFPSLRAKLRAADYAGACWEDYGTARTSSPRPVCWTDTNVLSILMDEP